MALGSHYKNTGLPLYEVTAMKKFTELHAPGLFNAVLKTIHQEDSRLSEDRRYLQEQRTVALLHIIAYFRCAHELLSTNKRVPLKNLK